MHQTFMQHAFEQAQKAAEQNEVPVGAVLVMHDEIITKNYNQPITLNDPTAHAEILVLREACQKIKNYRLIDAVLYVTLEPCAMCVGAMIHARIKQLIFGAYDPKSGAVSSGMNLIQSKHFNHRIAYQGGVMETECGQLLKDFFHKKRKR